MATALKEMYSAAWIKRLGAAITALDPTFDGAQLLNDCLLPDWDDLKLMQRSDRITTAMHAQLPADFKAAARLLRGVGPQFHGLTAVCLPNYVAKYGLDDWATSMTTLAVLTRYSTGEFAIRPFILKCPQQTAAQMLRWAQSANEDERRLASEGMRPRLPWGIRLKPYVADPSAIWPILTQLITDASEYVQKSVANNLNDISKDHPEQCVAFAQKYWGQTAQTNWILTRGLRTLVKRGDPAVLTLLGYDQHVADQLTGIRLETDVTTVELGETNVVTFQLTNDQSTTMPLYLGYRVHYVRLNKTDAYKDFFIKRLTLKGKQTFSGQFNVKWKTLTTRKLYPGEHQIDLLVNTRVVASTAVTLSSSKTTRP